MGLVPHENFTPEYSQETALALLESRRILKTSIIDVQITTLGSTVLFVCLFFKYKCDCDFSQFLTPKPTHSCYPLYWAADPQYNASPGEGSAHSPGGSRNLFIIGLGASNQIMALET